MQRVHRTVWLNAAACSSVGLLAAWGLFNSIFNFPLVFAAVCLGFGLLAAWRARSATSLPASAIVLLVGVAIAVAGWLYQKEQVRQGLVALQERLAPILEGRPAAALEPLEPLLTDRATLDATASFSNPATIISFWATWCSPCWQELRELQDLYDRHRGDGFAVLALTQYDQPDDAEGREEDRRKAERFLSRRGHDFPAAITASDELYAAYEVRAIPSSVLVDGSGMVVGYAVGLEGARELMAEATAIVTSPR